MKNPGPLKNFNVIITRPPHQNEELKNLILQQDGNPILLPAMTISFLENQALAQVLSNIQTYDLLIFTSQNAVIPVASKLPNKLNAQIAAIGPSTAAALKAHGLKTDYLPKNECNSEQLLSLPVFQKVSSKNIVIFSGVGGRTHLMDELIKRGATVIKVPVYQREFPRIDPATIKTLIKIENVVMTVTSCDGLQHLITLFEQQDMLSWLQQIPLLVISQRVFEFALKAGFSKRWLLLADGPTDDLILTRLSQWAICKS